jgi:FkbM family methyltransferase
LPSLLAVDPPFWAQHFHDAHALVKAANYTITFGGVLFDDVLYPSDLIQRTHVESGNFWEAEELAVVSNYIPDHGVVFNVGTNIGNNAIYWAVKANTSRVYAFEPIPFTFSLLKRNIELNGLEGKLIPINVAVGDGHEDLAIEAYTTDNIGGTRLKKDHAGTFPAIRLDEFEFPEQCVDFLKIDVEEFECNAVRGARNFLKTFHPAHIFIEVVAWDSKNWIDATFQELGYHTIRAVGFDNFIYEWRNDISD